MRVLAAQPGENGLGMRLLVGTIVGATEGGTGVRGTMDAPLILLSFPRAVSVLDWAMEMEDRRLITFSDNLLQFRVDTKKGLLPVKSSSSVVRGPEMDSCSPVIVSEIWWERTEECQRSKEGQKPQDWVDEESLCHSRQKEVGCSLC